ncbi:MAG: RNA-directed DNA polymerase [Alphaproteobacteria bacterium]|nr:RNA-directed DNA polymerase [Alphaproteobacteria bacterium]
MKIVDSKQEFIDSTTSFYNHIIKNSMVAFSKHPDKNILLSKLYDNISWNTYQPSLPREYIVYNKGRCVARIVPTFELNDYCVYFYCLNKLQDFVCDANDRVENTFGGWRIDNPIKKVEDLEQEVLLDFSTYSPYATLKIQGWLNEWKQFSQVSLGISEDYKEKYGDCFYVATFDVANFYDGIRIDILEKLLRSKVSNLFSGEIDLLLYFLKYWNKPFDGYFPRTSGIPQDEVGDCSRQLANFYLRDYDKKMYLLTQKMDATYLRYADDMMIFGKSKNDIEKIVFEASKLLHKIGLNINVGKVCIMSAAEYHIYEGFDILTKINSDDRTLFNDGVRLYFEYKKQERNCRYDRQLKRIMTLLAKNTLKYLDDDLHNKIIGEILSETMLSDYPVYQFNNLHKLIQEKGQEKQFFAVLDKMIISVNHNSFHYSLLRFYKSIKRKDFDYENLQNEIDKRKLRLGFL